MVEEAAQSFLRTGSTRVSLVGSADRSGTAAYNRKLSARRADVVRAIPWAPVTLARAPP